MKITRENLKNIVREAMVEESAYQEFFKKALEKTGKSIPDMSDEEKKAFFNKIDSAWKGKGEKNEERFGRGVGVGPTFGSADKPEDAEEIDEEAAMVHRRTPSGTIVSKLKEENELEEAQSPAQKAAFEKMMAKNKKKDGDDKSESVDERMGSDKGEVGNANFNNRLKAMKDDKNSVVVYIDTNKGKKLLKVFKTQQTAQQFKKKNMDKLLNTKGVESVGTMPKKEWDAKEAKYAIESVNEAKTYTPKQVKQALEKMVKQLKVKWKQKGGYENFGQKELRKFKDTFGYKPYGSSDEREITDLIDSFEDWAMDYSG